MKKKAIEKFIKKQVEAGVTDKTQISIALMQEGASLAQVNRMLNKQLVELGVQEAVVRSSSENVKALRALCTKKQLNSFKNYGQLDAWVNTAVNGEGTDDDPGYADIDAAKGMKIVREEAKAKEITLPTRINLGWQKQSVVDYFNNTDEKQQSLEGLAKYIEDTYQDVDKEKALHIARMNYGFAFMLYNRLSTSENC